MLPPGATVTVAACPSPAKKIVAIIRIFFSVKFLPRWGIDQ